MLINDVFQTDVLDKLNSLTDVSVLDGFLVHYSNDLEAGDRGISFPCVAVQLQTQNTNYKADVKSSEFVYTVIGAVSALDFSTVNTRMLQLLDEVRDALQVDFFTGDTKAQSIELGTATITLPDATDIYALFELTLEIKIIERGRK